MHTTALLSILCPGIIFIWIIPFLFLSLPHCQCLSRFQRKISQTNKLHSFNVSVLTQIETGLGPEEEFAEGISRTNWESLAASKVKESLSQSSIDTKHKWKRKSRFYRILTCHSGTPSCCLFCLSPDPQAPWGKEGESHSTSSFHEPFHLVQTSYFCFLSLHFYMQAHSHPTL